MEYIRFGKCSVRMAICVMLSLLAVNVIAQPGFVSISCGGKENHTDENYITWETDANYIEVGQTADIGDATQQAYGSYLHSIRFFPKPLNKSCYRLPVAPNVPYLFRASFALGNYTGFQKNTSYFNVSWETQGMLYDRDMSLTDLNVHRFEEIMVSSGTVLYFCLIRTSETDDPFISSIELRTLRAGMYRKVVKPGIQMEKKGGYNIGGNSMVRYPQDQFDRLWEPSDVPGCVRNISSEEPISTNNTLNLPPLAVMQTACVMENNSQITLGLFAGHTSLLVLYFADIEAVNATESRSFDILIHTGVLNKDDRETISMVPNSDAIERAFISNPGQTPGFSFSLMKAANSNAPPLINAVEYYLLLDAKPATYSQDIEALDVIRTKFGLKNWISDPCFMLPWDGIGCVNISSGIRISEIKLSGKNITGSVYEDFEQLTALVNVSLDNNGLTGPVPNFANLIFLERLHLQNNNLNGSIPDWLSELKNLKELHLQNNSLSGSIPDWLSELKNLTELFISDNNFSGVIPAKLVNKISNFRYYGNQYLCLSYKGGECNQQNPEKTNNSTKGVILGTILGGGLICGLLLGIAVYWKKLKSKQRFNERQDNSMVMVPNPTDLHAFTLQEIIDATKDFTKKIGQGGVGSVFFGTLPEGKDIAVKKLTDNSQRGVNQFHNEIALLSKVKHKNLLSLLGYCNESRELMLIYEYMSGGSLRDRLYGPSAGDSNLSWIERLKIASDAAQGLEFLHDRCDTKIIHRDVKSANILVDSDMNAKLADFGLSKRTRDGQASHASTMVKGTPGYIDPEYCRTNKLTERSDVYSFGVVLFEIICGRAPTNETEEAFDLVQWVTPYVKEAKIAEIIDRRLGRKYDMKSISAVAKLALRCVEARPSDRPSASEVVSKLKDAIMDEDDSNAELGTGIEYGYSKTAPMESGDSSNQCEPLNQSFALVK